MQPVETMVEHHRSAEDKMSRVLMVMAVVVMFIFASQALMWVTVIALRSAQSNQIANGNRTAGEICGIKNALGLRPDPDGRCFDEAVLPFWDPHALPTAGADSPGQLRNLAKFCAIETKLGIYDPDCPGGPFDSTTTTR